MPIPTTSFQPRMDWRDVVNSLAPPQKKNVVARQAVTDCVYEERGESKPLIGAQKKRGSGIFCPSALLLFPLFLPLLQL